jgi:hypothetical protein
VLVAAGGQQHLAPGLIGQVTQQPGQFLLLS